MERHELIAWLGEGQSDLLDEAVTQLFATANDIEARILDPIAREGALEAALYLLKNGSEIVVSVLSRRLHDARIAETKALAALRQAAVTIIHEGGRHAESEYGFAEASGIDRMTVRKWLGKR